MENRNCKNCGAQIASSAKACPQCGAVVKKPVVKKWWFWLLIAVAVIIVIAAAAGSGDSSENSEQTGGTPQTTTSEKTQTKEVYSVGETATLKDASITVNKVTKSQGSEFNRPKSGYEFVVVEVTIKNSGTSTISYDPFDFSMQNSQGNITSTSFSTVDDDWLQSGQLASGGTVTGTISFEEPVNDSELTLIYQGSLWSSSQLKFSCNAQ